MKRWKGTIDLLFDAVEETTDLVERTHASVAERSVRPFAVVEPLATVAGAVRGTHDITAKVVYKTIRAVTRGVKRLVDAGAAPFAGTTSGGLDTPLRSDAKGRLSWWMDHTEGMLNGLVGDHLNKRRNGLDLGMSLRHQGCLVPVERAVLKQAFPNATGKLCVFVHGLKCTEWVWSTEAERFYGDPAANFGTLLKADLGFTPFYVRYNTGRHVSENGRLLSTLLTQLIEAYPREVEEIVLVGHSMGGLVVRSAAHYGQARGEPWMRELRHIFCLGTPHLGAPLPKATNLVSNVLGTFETAGTQVPAQILNARSAGMKDLQFGYTLDEEWQDKDPGTLLADHRRSVPFVDGVGYYAIAATLTRDPAHPMGHLLGDWLVRPRSAAGHASEPARRIPFRSVRIFNGMNHFHLANHPDVYAFIRETVGGEQGGFRIVKRET